MAIVLSQIFKTREGCLKRVRFENAVSKGKYSFRMLRYLDGKEISIDRQFSRDELAQVMHRFHYQIERTTL